LAAEVAAVAVHAYPEVAAVAAPHDQEVVAAEVHAYPEVAAVAAVHVCQAEAATALLLRCTGRTLQRLLPQNNRGPSRNSCCMFS